MSDLSCGCESRKRRLPVTSKFSYFVFRTLAEEEQNHRCSAHVHEKIWLNDQIASKNHKLRSKKDEKPLAQGDYENTCTHWVSPRAQMPTGDPSESSPMSPTPLRWFIRRTACCRARCFDFKRVAGVGACIKLSPTRTREMPSRTRPRWLSRPAQQSQAPRQPC